MFFKRILIGLIYSTYYLLFKIGGLEKIQKIAFRLTVIPAASLKCIYVCPRVKKKSRQIFDSIRFVQITWFSQEIIIKNLGIQLKRLLNRLNEELYFWQCNIWMVHTRYFFNWYPVYNLLLRLGKNFLLGNK